VSVGGRGGVWSLLLLCFFTFFLGLGRQAITDSDEAYYAEASREMVETGDWLTPRFNYENRWQKPVLYYWLTAATFLVTGPTALGARLWSAAAGLGLVLLAWAVARQASGRSDASWLAGAIVATCFGYFAMARAALPDLPLTFCITLGIWAALRAADAPRDSGMAAKWWALAGLGAGLGFLLKGPVALAVPAIVLLPIVWRERRRMRIDPRGVALAALVFAAVGLPWYVVMWREHGNAYLQSFFVGDNIERFATERFNDARPFWFYLPVVLGGMIPWSLYLIDASGRGLAGVIRRTRVLTDPEWRLLLWALMPLLFYTLSVGKQPRYILPILPPLAVLLARSMVERLDAVSTRAPSGLAGATWATAALYALLALLLARMEPLLINAYPAATWTGVCLMGCGAIGFAWIAVRGGWRRLPAVGAIAAAALIVSVQFGALAGRRPEAVEQMATLVRAERSAQEPIGVFGVFTRNLPFYTASKQMELFDRQQAGAFAQSPERVLLILRSNEITAVETQAGITLRRLGEVEYLNTASLRIRTLVRPDPREEIQKVSLVSNR
jgi:4-amino-4-deoxy-L-arabinose transferase-like glycosyltransferase